MLATSIASATVLCPFLNIGIAYRAKEVHGHACVLPNREEVFLMMGNVSLFEDENVG